MNAKLKKILERQHYCLVKRHSAVQICRWCKKSLIDSGSCYKEKFYGIKSSLCCQMSPAVAHCHNKCKHCWRAIEYNAGIKIKEEDTPKEIIDGCILAQRKMLSGFGGNKKINKKKFKEAQEPMQFAISLSGEPTIYSKIGQLIEELRKRGKTSFLVSNGLLPEKLKELARKNQLPTQLYISLNSPNKEHYKEWHKSCLKDAWERFNKSLSIMKQLKGKTRTVLRMTIAKDENMKPEFVKGYAKLIRKAMPWFVEVKAWMAVGFSRNRMEYKQMPLHGEIRDFAKLLARELKKEGYKILDEKKESRVVLLGKGRREMKIKRV